MSIQLRRGTNAERGSITPLEGELIYATDTKLMYVGDGVTLGGVQVSGSGGLSGSLAGLVDLGNYSITGTGLTINGNTGDITATSFNGVINASLGSNLTIGTRSVTNGTNLTLNGATGKIEAATLSISGGLAANLSTGAHSITNGTNLTLNGTTGNISTATLNVSDSVTANKLYSDNITTDQLVSYGTIEIGDADNNNQLLIHWEKENATIPFMKVVGVNKSTFETPRIVAYSSRGSLAAPTANMIGDAQIKIESFGYDGSTYLGCAGIVLNIDQSGNVSSGHVPGSIVFYTQTDGTSNTVKAMSFDASGRLAINKITAATATLDVNGTAKFAGFVQFGSLTGTERTALTPVNGMVIYNTTSNRFEGYQNGGWIHLDNGTAA